VYTIIEEEPIFKSEIKDKSINRMRFEQTFRNTSNDLNIHEAQQAEERKWSWSPPIHSELVKLSQNLSSLDRFINEKSQKIIKTKIIYKPKKKKKKASKVKLVQRGVVLKDCICEVNGD